MARIELSNIGGGGTTLSLTTTGTSGASTLAGSVLNIPIYQGQLTLTTTGTSGAATLSGDILNIPNYATGGSPAGSAGQVQFNSTPAGSFAASANLAWDNSAVQLNIGAPSFPTGKLNVKGSGTLTTVNTRLTDSGNTELVKVLDNGSTNIGANFNWDNVNGRLGLGTSTPNQTLEVSGAMRLTGTAGTADFMLGRNSAGDVSTVTLGTTGTSGAATLSANVLNVPQYQGALTLTTTGTSGAATLVGTTLNIPQYSGGGGGTPAGSAGQVQFNSTPAGSFAASTAFVFDTAGPYLKVGAAAPSATVGVNGAGTLSGTTSLHVRNSSSVDLLKVNDNGQFLLGENGTALTTNRSASIEVSSTNTNVGIAIVPKGTGAITAAIPDGTTTGGNARGNNAIDLQLVRGLITRVASGSNSTIAGGRNNTASGSDSFAVGSLNTASGSGAVAVGASCAASATGSVSIGTNSTASAPNSIAVGNACTSSGAHSVAMGDSCTAANTSSFVVGTRGQTMLTGQKVFSQSRFAANGDSQYSNLVVSRSITGTAAAELTLTNAAPDGNTRIILNLTGATNGRLWNAIVQLSAICTTAGGTVTVGESFIGTYNLGIKRISNTTSLVGTVQNMITAQADTNMSSSVVTITADDANESLKIEFTPPTGANASTVIRVVATVYLTEVGY